MDRIPSDCKHTETPTKGKEMTSQEPTGRPCRDALVHRYLFGECMVMADTLARMHRVPMVGIHDDVWTDVPRHVGVLTGKDAYGDARGLRLDRQAFLDGYEAPGTRIAPVTADELRRIWGRRIGSWQVPVSEIETLGLDQRSFAA